MDNILGLGLSLLGGVQRPPWVGLLESPGSQSHGAVISCRYYADRQENGGTRIQPLPIATPAYGLGPGAARERKEGVRWEGQEHLLYPPS